MSTSLLPVPPLRCPPRLPPAPPAVSPAPRRPALSPSPRVHDAAPPWPVRDETLVLRDVPLDGGEVLPAVRVRYRLEGTLSPTRDNVVVVVHALTGTVHATHWWPGVVGAGAPIDPHRHAVLCANLLGGCDGTSGPRTDATTPFPGITTRDQARVLARLLEALGLDAPVAVVGGSLGGMVTLEFAASWPERVRQAVVLAAPARQTALGLAWNAIMRRALAIGGARDGLALARMVGMLSYRTGEGLEQRFGATRDATGALAVEQWLHHHGDRLVARFDAASYAALIDAMDRHDVGAGRGGVARALAPVADRLTAVGIPGDLLFPGDVVEGWARSAGVRYVAIPSVHGHDAFLLEPEQVATVLRDALGRSGAVAAPPPP